MLLSGFAEIFSLGALVPFLAALAAPEKVIAHPLVNRAASFFAPLWDTARLPSVNPESPSFLIFLAAVFACSALVAAGIRLITMACSLKFSNAAGLEISSSIYQRILYQPYETHLSRHTSEVISGITAKMTDVTSILFGGLNLATSMILVPLLILTLLAVSPWAAGASFLFMASCYLLVGGFSLKILKTAGAIVAQEQPAMVRVLQEGLGGIRDVILDGTQDFYVNLYRRADSAVRGAYSRIIFFGNSPRFILEALGMSLFALMAVFLVQTDGGLAEALPVLGVLALAAQRMLPTFQQGYNAWSTIHALRPSLRAILQLLEQPGPITRKQLSGTSLDFEKEIEFRKVRFRYRPDQPWILDGVSFRLPRGARVGFTGETGSGKSTCLDLLMGLLQPTEGEILVDGKKLTPENNHAWQKNIAHVSQFIFLIDSTVAENIALSRPAEPRNRQGLREAARLASLADFIEAEPLQYETLVGERGVRLSGGQRQRIGIARALYKRTPILVLDEATNALDLETEQAVLTSIFQGLPRVTLFMINHRPQSLEFCDRIVEIKGGQAWVK